jgi:hypothetical protein
MLTAPELSALSTVDAALERAADDADAAAAETSGSLLTIFSSTASAMAASARANAESERQWLEAWRAQRDQALASSEDDPDAVSGLVLTAQDHLKSTGAVVELGAAVSSALPNAVRKTAGDVAAGAAQVGKDLAHGVENAASTFAWVGYVLPIAALAFVGFIAWSWVRPPRSDGARGDAVKGAVKRARELAGAAVARARGRS